MFGSGGVLAGLRSFKLKYEPLELDEVAFMNDETFSFSFKAGSTFREVKAKMYYECMAMQKRVDHSMHLNKKAKLETIAKYEVFEKACLAVKKDTDCEIRALGIDLPPGLFDDDDIMGVDVLTKAMTLKLFKKNAGEDFA